MYKRDPQTGEITNYAHYDKDGNIVKRVDLNHAHGTLKNKHVHIYGTNTAPNGKKYIYEIGVRNAESGEIPE